MTNRILVTYTTMTGSTKGVSEAIGKTLSDLGESVDVIPMREVKDIPVYKAVIAGLPEAIDFIETHKHDL
jgi:menaquinone-dependent protoporphyrinogen IX oxidase